MEDGSNTTMNMLAILKKETVISTVIITGLLTAFTIIIAFAWNESFFNTEEVINSEKFAQLGDFIGGVVGSLWALAGVFLFYKALTEQRVDFKNNKDTLQLQVSALNQQIEEFKLNREEQRLSRKVYEEQSKTAKIQQFDSSFYSLLNVYLTIKNTLSHQNPEYFKQLTDKLESFYDENELCLIKRHVSLVSGFIDIYNNEREALSRYFRAFYRLIIIIDSSKALTEEEKYFYAKILRAQLSDYELVILFYNSFTFLGKKTQNFALKYNIFKHLPLLNLPSLKEYQSKQDDHVLMVLVDILCKFMMKNIPLFYDVTFEESKIEEEFNELGIILGVYFNDGIEIKIYTNLDIKENKINLSEDELIRFIKLFFYEFVIFKTYLVEKVIVIEESKIEFADKKAFCIAINTEELISLNEDKF
ncbi:putative phage abortive infection protein [Thalassotalea sp. PP2-459]|uniref:putative phage abortive infection protein n=1 Tax=Thalassotalea sp. PP2-459 TaxID=1742724 RepID=UPI0009450BA4|nr:putative phage abortive infection protein [Thalassotalea sp. PP2-459]OKY24974.1 hypothetical protein BI291_04455 [Thalassotalea sp. PP2-459]